MGRLGPYSLLLLAAAAALATGWLIPRLPGGWAVALGLFALALVLAILVRELSRAVPGELHLARARLGMKARRAPSIYVRRLFNSYAQRYDRHLFTELDYQVPNLLRDLVDGWVRDGALDVADLGCGTGALGRSSEGWRAGWTGSTSAPPCSGTPTCVAFMMSSWKVISWPSCSRGRVATTSSSPPTCFPIWAIPRRSWPRPERAASRRAARPLGRGVRGPDLCPHPERPIRA